MVWRDGRRQGSVEKTTSASTAVKRHDKDDVEDEDDSDGT